MEEAVRKLLENVKQKLTLEGRKRVFEEMQELKATDLKEIQDPEEFTRGFLIDKLLFDFFSVTLIGRNRKFKTPKGERKVDYAVSSQQKFLIEAKPINADLTAKHKDSALSQIQGLFTLAEVREDYAFGVATDGIVWIFVSKKGDIIDELHIERDYEQIKRYVVGEEVIRERKLEDISKRFYEEYNDLLHGTKRISKKDCLVNSILHVESEEDREEIAQILVDRLIFIKFLQSKGIIKEDVLDFLHGLEEYELNLKLDQLFFEVMNTREEERGSVDPHFSHIPYLNGSLFEKLEVEKRNPNYKIRAEILRRIIEFLNKFRFVHFESLENQEGIIDPEILGYIFERAMTATDRKGTGAYYTPKEITKYIAENTIYPVLLEKVNKFLKEEKGYRDTELLKDIEDLFILPATTLNDIWLDIVLKLTICDNACGSGAFLLAAANILFALNKKINDVLGRRNTDASLKRLALRSLYGVDINPRAVEIAMLRLWLWLAESYEPDYIQPLPNIEYNLRVGNSLIGFVDIEEFAQRKVTLDDFADFEETTKKLLDQFITLKAKYRKASGDEARKLRREIEDIRLKVKRALDKELFNDFYEKGITDMTRDDFYALKPFHWGFEFYEIFDLEKPKDERGFDVVIGNPPYVKLHNINKQALKYYFRTYKTAEKKCDIYAFFTERSLIFLLREKGILAYIMSNTWLNLDSFVNLRRIVTKENKLLQIVELENPFPNVTVSPIIFIVKRQNIPNYSFKVYKFDFVNWHIINKNTISSQTIVPPLFLIDLTITPNSFNLLTKINQQSIPLSKIAKLQYGIMTANNKKFVICEPKAKQHKPLLSGEDIRRYRIEWSGHRYIDYRPDEMKKKKTARPGEPERFEQKEKIIFQRYSSTKLIATLDTSQFYTLGTTIICRSTTEYSNKYILGVINSKLLSWWYGRIFTSPTNYIREFEELPIRTIDFSNPDEKALHDRVVALVEKMLSLHRQLAEITDEHEKKSIEKEIEETDREIDALVYELYGLTDEEIAIVEESVKD